MRSLIPQARRRRDGRPPAWAVVAALAAGALLLAACAGGRPPRLGPSGPDVELSPRPSPGGPPLLVRPTLAQAAELNARDLRTLPIAPFGRPETGWEIYMPTVAALIGAQPVPQGVDFARALARWQAAHNLPDDGVMTAAVFGRLRDAAQARRPFLAARAGGGACPDPPDEATLAWSTPEESWAGVIKAMRPAALAAWRRMRAAARRDGAFDSPLSLQIFSGYRSPAYDAGRCAVEGTCDNVRRATCSAHRTGLALDMVLDGVRPVDSTSQIDRLRLSRASAYRWLVLNAARFGFVNYLFEPWHWEWTGEPVVSPSAAASPSAGRPPPPPPPVREATDLLPPG